MHIFLERSGNNHLWCLPQPCIDDFHPGIAQSAGDHFGPAVMAVQSGFRHQHTDFTRIRHGFI
jgi:hypothetical protein